MSDNILANAPLIITDIPTSDEFYAGTSSSSAIDPNRPFAQSNGLYASQFLCLDTTPDGFRYPHHAKGVIGVFSSSTNTSGAGATLRIAVHKPTHNIGDYSTGWAVIDNASITFAGTGPNTSFLGYAAIASQRKGDYSYVLLHNHSAPLFSDTVDVLQIYKVTRGEYVERGPISGAGSLNGNALGNSILNGQIGQFFVSDDEQPFLWNLYGQVSFSYKGGTAATPPIVVTGFRDDGNTSPGWQLPSGTTIRTNQMYGQAGAYYQLYDIPDGQYGVGPYLVFPWADDDYSPPELWFVLVDFDSNGHTTGKFNIYRSKWTRGAYQAPASRDGTNNFVINDPDLNSRGYAFDHDWYKPENFVASIGPFPNTTVFNPHPTASANYQNTKQMNPASILTPNNIGFNFQRDKSKSGVLHMFAQASAGNWPTNTNNGYDAAWYINSTDDGATWSNPKQLTPAARPALTGTMTSFASNFVVSGQPTKQGYQRTDAFTVIASTLPNMSVVRTNEDMMLLGGVSHFISYTAGTGAALPLRQLPMDAGGHVALIAIDYTGRGFAAPDRSPVIFRNGVTRGQVAWQ